MRYGAEPGIQNEGIPLYLDSGPAASRRPGMTAENFSTVYYGFRLAAFQYFSRFEISAGLKWQ